MVRTFKIAAIPGDGIGAEVVSAKVELLHAIAQREDRFTFKFDEFDWGGGYVLGNKDRAEEMFPCMA